MRSSAQGIGMTAEFGVFALIIALLASLLQGAYLLPVAPLRAALLPCLAGLSHLRALFVLLAFAVLITLRLDSDFTVENVIIHSNLSLPTLYKIVGTWGNHEGSLLLWAALLSLFSAVFAGFRAPADGRYALAAQGCIMAGFLLFMLATSSPFIRHFPPPVDGQALNPLLQDVALSLHPPMLYAGYVGFAIVFSLAVAALFEGRMSREWAQAAHPWILLSWSSLTFGIGLGSWWAYRVLGWGGWWFWDPVENCSLLPWLCGTALLHANIVLKKRGLLAQWVALLAILTFGLSLLGTFLVRSGVLTSVHSFASDPGRGIFILLYITFIIGGALLLFSLRAGKVASGGGMALLSREGLIVVNNMFVLCACATVLLGTLYPMFMDIAGQGAITVGAPYFNATFLPLMAIPLLFAGLTPFLPWQKASGKQVLQGLVPAALGSAAAAILVLAFAHTERALAILGFGIAAWLATSSVKWVWRVRSVRGTLGVFTAHFGAAVLVAGITGMSLWKEEHQQAMAQGDVLHAAGLEIKYVRSLQLKGENYQARQTYLDIMDGQHQVIGHIHPEYRTYDIRNMTISQPAIAFLPMADLYVVVGEKIKDEDKLAVRVYYNPMIRLIWAGFMLMALGGVFAIIQRMRRI